MSDRPSSAPGESVPIHQDDVQAGALLSRLHEARGAGDRETAADAWQRIVIAEIERVRGLVLGFRDDALPGGRVSPEAIDEVVVDAFRHLHANVDLLVGHGVGELRAFMRTATRYACLDAGTGEGTRAASALELRRFTEHLTADTDDAEIARAMIHPALALVDDDKRGVLVMSESGYGVDTMSERFGLSRDAVLSHRRRALHQLSDGILELAERGAAHG